MPERTKAAARILIVLSGTLVALVVAQFISAMVLALFVTVDAQGRYSIDLLRGDGQWLALSNLASLVTFVLLTVLIVKIVYWRRPLDRMVVIVGGYAGACVAAGLVLFLVFYAIGHASRASPMVGLGASGGFEALGSLYMATVLASIYVGVFALLPTLPVIIYTERKGVRSPLFYGIAGAASALVAIGIYLAVFLLAGAPPSEIFRGASMLVGWLLLFGAPGIVGGLAYWLIAGRTTGERPTSIVVGRAA